MIKVVRARMEELELNGKDIIREASMQGQSLYAFHIPASLVCLSMSLPLSHVSFTISSLKESRLCAYYLSMRSLSRLNP